MNEFGLKFHHFGLATKKPEAAIVYLQSLGYRKGDPVFDPLQSVNLLMFRHAEMPAVELIWANAVVSPIDNLLKRRDGLIYHLCYVSQDTEKSLASIRAAGLTIIQVVAPKAAMLFGGNPVSFHHIENIGLIEIIEGEPKIT